MQSPSAELKELISRFSAEYFADQGVSDSETSFFNDMCKLSPRDRITTMLRLLKFVLPEMKGADIAVDMLPAVTPLRSRLAKLISESLL